MRCGDTYIRTDANDFWVLTEARGGRVGVPSTDQDQQKVPES